MMSATDLPAPLAGDAEAPAQQAATPNKKRQKRDVHGWIVLDKPIGMTSTHAVSVVRRLFTAKRAGHAGTLDPLASGCLPIALGEATKTVPFVMDGRKIYQFTVRWREERDDLVRNHRQSPLPGFDRLAYFPYDPALRFEAAELTGRVSYDRAGQVAGLYFLSQP